MEGAFLGGFGGGGVPAWCWPISQVLSHTLFFLLFDISSITTDYVFAASKATPEGVFYHWKQWRPQPLKLMKPFYKNS